MKVQWQVRQSTSQTPLLHPSLGELYRSRITTLREVLDSDNSEAAEAVDLLRGLIDRVVITPAETSDAAPDILLEGDLAGILRLAQTSKKAAGLSSDDLMQIKLAAGARNQRCRTHPRCLLSP